MSKLANNYDGRPADGAALYGRSQNHLLELSAQGLGVLQRADAADQPEPGVVLDPRHILRWQRTDHVRAAGFARTVADPHRAGLRCRAKRRSGISYDHRGRDAA